MALEFFFCCKLIIFLPQPAKKSPEPLAMKRGGLGLVSLTRENFFGNFCSDSLHFVSTRKWWESGISPRPLRIKVYKGHYSTLERSTKVILGAFKPSYCIYVVRKRWFLLFQFLLLFFSPFKLLIDLHVFNLGTALEIKVLTRISSKLSNRKSPSHW